jgi:BNR repeat-containing family member
MATDSRARGGIAFTCLGIALLAAGSSCSNSGGARDGSSAPVLGGSSGNGGSSASASTSGPVPTGGLVADGGNATGGNGGGGMVTRAGGIGAGGANSGGTATLVGGANAGGNTSGSASTSGGNGSGGAGGNSGGNTATGGAATGGTVTGGNATGGSVTGGNATGGSATGGSGTGGSATGGTGTGGSATGGAGAGIGKDGEVVLTKAGLTIVSYGGYLNGESFQQDGIVSYGGYQYAAFWNTSRHVVLGRRILPTGAWSTLELADYTLSADDAHNTISIGICPGDGTLHLSFDHHGNNLHYRKSVAGFVTNPATAIWAASSFSTVTSALAGTTTVALVTYPRFVTEPGGNKMLFEARIGASGSGDEYLWEYDGTAHAWTALGMFVNGTVDSINAYPHGLSYTQGGTRLHMSWCWRETPDASTNHDLYYINSDDHGRTWKNNAGTTVATTGSTYVTKSSLGIKVWTVNQNRGLINQEHMAVDSTGRVHVLLSHMPDAQADDAIFDSARTKSQFFHYWRSTNGTWTRVVMGLPVVANFRGKLAIASSNNLYAILPDLRIAAAMAASNFAIWTVLDSSDAGRFFSDPLIDTARLSSEDKLTIFYPLKSSPNISILDYSIK